MVPVGELPRHMLLSAERYLTGRVIPGSRVIATGIYSTFQNSTNSKSSGAVALRTPYLRVIGLEIDADGAGRTGSRVFTAEEEEEFQALARSGKGMEGGGGSLYERFAGSIGPSIYGNVGKCRHLVVIKTCG